MKNAEEIYREALLKIKRILSRQSALNDTPACITFECHEIAKDALKKGRESES